jgi:hypothetical protein
MTREEHQALYNRYFGNNGNPLEYTKIAYYPDRDSNDWDYTIDDSIELLGIYHPEFNRGGWTDVTYNADGTFTHTPTAIDDIPIDRNNVRMMTLLQDYKLKNNL